MMHSKLAGRGPGDFWRGDFWECVGSFRVGIRVKPEVDPPKDSSLTRGVSMSAGDKAKSFSWDGKVASGALAETGLFVFRSYPFVFSCLCFRLRNRDVRNDLEKVFKEII